MANIIPTFGKQVFAGRQRGGTPTQAEALNVGFGQGNPNGTRITALTSDKGLAGEYVANGAQTTRLAGTSSLQTTTNTNDTWQVTGTQTCNLGGGLALVEVGLFDANAYPGADTVATLGVLTGTGTGTFTVSSGTSFATAAADYEMDQEVMTCTRSGTTMTITARGVNGSTAAAHSGTPNIICVSNSGTGNGGTMAAKSDFAVINQAQNDTLTPTLKVQFT